jgi:hypothetical protein
MATQIVTHETIEKRRQLLRETDTEAHLALKERRYALFRVQNFLGGGAMADPDHIAVAQELEAETAELGGVAEFAKKWDIDPLTGRVIARDRSVWQAHQEFMRRAAPEFGSKESLQMAQAAGKKLN